MKTPSGSPATPEPSATSPSAPAPRSRARRWLTGHRLVAVIVSALVALVLVAVPGQAALRGIGLIGGGSPQAGPAPANDTFVAAAPVAGADISGTTVDATADADEVAAGVAPAGQHVVWFTWSPSVHGWAYVTSALVGDARPQPSVRVYEGSTIGSLTQVDQPPTGGGPAGVSVPAVAGRTYAVAVIDAGAGSPFDLRVLQPDAGVRANDEPSGAIDVGAGVLQAAASSTEQQLALDTLGGATAASGEPAVGGLPAEHSVWFAWQAPPGGGTLGVGAQPALGGPGPFRVAAWTGTSMADLAFVSGGGDSLDLDAVGGTRYLFSVDGPEGYFDLRVNTTGVAGPDVTPPQVSCGPAPSGWATAAVSIPCTATDAGSGLANPADASFALVVDAPDNSETSAAQTGTRSVCDRSGNCAKAGPITSIQIDRRSPQVACDQVPAGWTIDNPTVICRALDAGSGLVDPADAERSVTPSVPEGSAAQVALSSTEVCDAAGNCAPAKAIGSAFVDRQPPLVTCDPAPAGVQRENITIACQATDGAGSGLADAASATFTLETTVSEGEVDPAAMTASKAVCDDAGNCATAGPVGPTSIDRAAPSVRCTPPTGWARGAVSIPCSATDTGSGLATGTPDPLVLTADLGDGSESPAVASNSTSVCDVAGNCTTAGPVTVSIDRKAPQVACDPAPAGWSRSAVTVRCGATDEGSGLAQPATSAITLRAESPPDQETTVSTGSLAVCDLAGNCATAGPVSGIRMDTRPPVVTCDAPPSGLVRTEAVVRCRAVDDGSGLFDPAGADFELVTAVGPGHVNATAPTDSREVCDAAGNCKTAGPFTAHVDRTVDPEPGPPLTVPAKVTVLAAVDPVVAVPVPYSLPVAPGLDVACQPAPGTPLHEGWTVVVCEATDANGVSSLGAFRVVVKPMPQLAAHTNAVAGGAWRVVGVGFAPGSPVQVELDGAVVAGAGVTGGGDGRVNVTITIPADLPPGGRMLVLRGTDTDGNPLLVVSPFTLVVAAAGTEPPSEPPPGAPALPPTGPPVPPDPSPAPPLPQLYAAPAPSSSTSSSSTSSTSSTSSIPGASTTASSPGSATSGGPGATTTLPGGATTVTGGAESTSTSGGITGALPVTGAALGLLALIALILLVVGRTLKSAGRRLGADAPDDE